MKVSLNWIRDYVQRPADADLKKLAYDLTMSTVEVEDATDLGASSAAARDARCASTSAGSRLCPAAHRTPTYCARQDLTPMNSPGSMSTSGWTGWS